MHCAFVTCGLPGPAYHGGAVTCWAIIRALRAAGHQVTLVSLFDTSANNPYLESRHAQRRILEALGVAVVFVDHNYDQLRVQTAAATSQSYWQKLQRPLIERFLPWAYLRPGVDSALAAIHPDVVFCYHFDALAATYHSTTAPIVAGVGDLWHLPGWFRWRAQTNSFTKYTVDLGYQLVIRSVAQKLMCQMLTPCVVRGAFAAHYADWLCRHGVPQTHYFRTPAHDPVGAGWQELRQQKRAHRSDPRPRLLLMGDITGTAAQSGLRLLVRDILPRLDRALGRHGFVIHLVGAGQVADQFRAALDRPEVVMRGRVTPPDDEFLSADVLLVPTPITLGIRVRIITGWSYGSCLVTHRANAAGIPEINHRVNALVGASGSALARLVVEALQRPDLRHTLMGGARQTFAQFFSEASAGQAIVRQLETAAQK